MKKIIFFIFLLTIFTGCSTKQSFILYNNDTFKSSKSFIHSIGIKDIELPQYLLSKKIPFLKDSNQIIYLKNKAWATYLDEHLTNRVVSTLQNSFNTPKVYKYPYSVSDKPDIIIQITINKFIANENEVILEATSQINGLRKDNNQLFSIKIPIDSKKDIIIAMNKAFTIYEKRLIEILLITYQQTL